VPEKAVKILNNIDCKTFFYNKIKCHGKVVVVVVVVIVDVVGTTTNATSAEGQSRWS